MAWLFSLAAECGPEKSGAEAFAQHFKRLSVSCDGTEHICGTQIYEEDGAWWVVVGPNGVSRSGIRNDEDRRQMTKIGLALYERLRSAPPYRYAIVGIEADGFSSFDDLDDALVDPAKNSYDGLVIADSIWQRLRCPGIFVPFTAGYRWRPFSGAN
jgi:hypothetical protein